MDGRGRSFVLKIERMIGIAFQRRYWLLFEHTGCCASNSLKRKKILRFNFPSECASIKEDYDLVHSIKRHSAGKSFICFENVFESFPLWVTAHSAMA